MAIVYANIPMMIDELHTYIDREIAALLADLCLKTDEKKSGVNNFTDIQNRFCFI